MVNVDKNAVSPVPTGIPPPGTGATPQAKRSVTRWAYPPAIEDLQKAEALSQETELRQVKYLNNLIEQDYRFIKRRTNPGLGFGSFNTARRTIQGYEAMNMVRKGQIQGVEKGDILGQVGYARENF